MQKLSTMHVWDVYKFQRRETKYYTLLGPLSLSTWDRRLSDESKGLTL